MATVTPLRRHVPELDDCLRHVRALVLAQLPGEGHVSTRDPDLCFYRFGQTTRVSKAATFGVTLAVVLQGQKQLRVGEHTLQANPERLMVITRETEIDSTVLCDADGAYLGMSL